jgi:endonuclease/exonuclease/phosphatase family metal-dependent hydrolase
MERFFDTVNDPTIGEPILTPAAFEKRLNKASLAIRNVMLMPDILGVQEIENLTTLQSLASRINADAVADGDPNPGYVAYLFEGNDPGGIDVGFLARSSRVTDVIVVQEGKAATYLNPTSNEYDLLNDRPPLVLTAKVNGPSITQAVTVIVNHLRSLDGVDDLTDGRVRAKRLAQAEFLANLIQARQAANPNEQIVSVGDYNAYEFSDGYVDVSGSSKGSPAPHDEVVLTGADLVDPDLTDLTALAPAAERYSYSYEGNAQLLDHIFVNNAALSRFSRVSFARSNADFPESYRSDATRPERLSDHDMPVAYFMFHKPATLEINGPDPMTIECGSTFTDPGATATDEIYGDISHLIVTSGQVNTGVVGSYTITYAVNNGFATTTATRTVNVVDTTPPVMSAVVPSVSFLWPPNHQLESVGLNYTVTDKSGWTSCSVGVMSNEPLDGTGDGDTAPDWLVNESRGVQLRAERAGTGAGRVYAITVTCGDASGNSASQNATVRVPKSMGNGKK